ncbi:hypothetical protein [Methylomonas sp. ZR1]|uniref:hypothetical protein n=1 Tax=unclassified Methylomonas TaxID=2608980 RepID=UPI001490B86B|nr:hypothetical protein [Methylomonas sp. ZR1]
MLEDNSISLSSNRDVLQIHAATCLLMPKETALAEDEILSNCVTPQSDFRLARP